VGWERIFRPFNIQGKCKLFYSAPSTVPYTANFLLQKVLRNETTFRYTNGGRPIAFIFSIWHVVFVTGLEEDGVWTLQEDPCYRQRVPLLHQGREGNRNSHKIDIISYKTYRTLLKLA